MADSASGLRPEALKDRTRYRHWVSDTIRYSDTDMVGHVNNLAFAAYCETGRTRFMHEFPRPLIGREAQTVLARLSINFLDEIHWPGEVEIGTGVLRIGNSSLTLGQGLFTGGRCFATAEAIVVMIDRVTRKPRPLPEEFRGWLADYSLE